MNQFALFGGLAALGGGAAAAWRQGTRIWTAIKALLVTTLVISDQDDPVFEWVNRWFTDHPYSKRTRSLTVWVDRRPSDFHEGRGRDEAPDVHFAPAPGLHAFRYEGTWVWVNRHRETMTQSSNGTAYRDTYNLTFLTRNRSVPRQLVEEARAAWIVRRDGKLRIRLAGSYDWRSPIDHPLRPTASVILGNGQLELLVADARQFLESAEWYAERGVPWRRGYLLYGPPGNGKTSAILALASELRREIAVLSLSARGMDDLSLLGLMQSLSPGAMVVIEDIDAAFRERESTDEDASQITFSGLLRHRRHRFG